jgi:poly-gamma-glutamate synthesis protein (capsule biosynthesis protein)
MKRILLLIVTLCLSAVGGSSLTLSVECPADLWFIWQGVAQRSPLPEGIDVVRVEPGTRPAGAAASLSMAPRGVPAAPGARIVGAVPRVPVGRLGESGPVSRADAETGARRLVPLSEVALPQVALPVDGVFPDQDGYPFWDDVVLSLSADDQLLRDWYAGIPQETSLPSESILWLGAVGDVMPARGVDAALLAPGGVDRVFGNTLPVLRSCRLLMGNLESSAATGGAPQRKSYTFRFRADALGKLKEAGFSWLSLTNNHTFDFGRAGFLETLAALSRWGIPTSGAGVDIDQASVPSVLMAGAAEVRVLSFGAYPVERTGFNGYAVARAGPSRPGILWLDDDGFSAAERAFAPGGLNVAFVHGGREWSSTPTEEQVRLYRELVRRGASVVLGAHPHVLQRMEAFEGGLIVYSLGNFLFPGMDGTPGGEDSEILKLGIFGGRVRYVQKVAVRLNGDTVRLSK